MRRRDWTSIPSIALMLAWSKRLLRHRNVLLLLLEEVRRWDRSLLGEVGRLLLRCAWSYLPLPVDWCVRSSDVKSSETLLNANIRRSSRTWWAGRRVDHHRTGLLTNTRRRSMVKAFDAREPSHLGSSLLLCESWSRLVRCWVDRRCDN